MLAGFVELVVRVMRRGLRRDAAGTRRRGRRYGVCRLRLLGCVDTASGLVALRLGLATAAVRRRCCGRGRFREEGGGPTVEVHEVVLVVVVDAVLGEEFEAVVPKALEAEVEHVAAKVVRNVGEVVFGICSHSIVLSIRRLGGDASPYHCYLVILCFDSSMTEGVGHLRGDPQNRRKKVLGAEKAENGPNWRVSGPGC
jgi:hypothetical protein